MSLLAFDTSTAQGSVALIENGKVLAERSWFREKSHSEFLTAEVEATLREAGVSLPQVTAFAIGHGPGSFTGIRVAVNAAKSLGYALQKNTLVFTTNEIIAAAVNRFDLPLLTLVNAQKNSFFTQSFVNQNGSWIPISEIEYKTFNEVFQILQAPHLCVGDGCREIEAVLSPDQRSGFVRDDSLSDYPSAVVLAKLAEASAEKRKPLVWNAVQALYLRASGAEEKSREGLKR